MKFQPNYLTGKVTQLLVTTKKEDFVTTAVQKVEATFDGFPSDRHSGNTRVSGGREKVQYRPGTTIRNNRQWSALSEEELVKIADNMGVDEVKAEWVGANLIFEGIPDFSKLPPLSHIMINPDSPDFVCLIVFEENGPCKYPNKVIEEETQADSLKNTFMIGARGLRGTVGWVDKPGVIRVGDEVRVMVPLV